MSSNGRQDIARGCLLVLISVLFVVACLTGCMVVRVMPTGSNNTITVNMDRQMTPSLTATANVSAVAEVAGKSIKNPTVMKGDVPADSE